MNETTYGCLFSGYGGLTMGIQQVIGGTTLWHSENNPQANKILAHHWPNTPNLGDITQIDWDAVPPVDVITGGSPCQDLSSAGQRAGMKQGTRSGLWESMALAVSTLRPKLVVWENVKGALHAEADSNLERCPECVGNGRGRARLRALGRVLGDLATIGYDANWYSLRASDVGAAHNRARIFLFARPVNGDNQLNVEPSPVRALPWQDNLRFLPIPTVFDSHGAGKHGVGGPDLRTALDFLPTPRASDGAHGGPNMRGAKGDLALPSAVHSEWGKYADAITRHTQALGRPAPLATEPNTKGDMRLSPRFVEWMMMLPDGHVTDVPGLSRTAQLAALGNGVVPAQAAAACRMFFTDLATQP